MKKIRPEALDWLEEARADLRHASEAYRLGSYNWACFAAEQSAEKAIKAFLMGAMNRRPIHVHDLTVLYRQAKGRLSLPEAVSERLAELSAHYTSARYPNSGLNRPSVAITSNQARRAIQTARGILRIVQKQLAK